MKKIVICGGHLTPAISTVEGLESNADLRVFFLTRKHVTEGSASLSAEYLQIRERNVVVVPVVGGKLQRHLTRYSILAFLKIPISFIHIFFRLLLIGPDLVVGFGGPLGFPAVFCSWLLGIPSVIHEQATKPGLSNQLSANLSHKIFVSWPQAKKYFPAGKTTVIGNLVRTGSEKIDEKLAKFLKTEGELLLVVGGNQGSHFLNELITQNVDSFSNYKILHVLGKANFEDDHGLARKIKTAKYFATDYLNASEMELSYQKARIVLARSGANTVWDIAAHGKVAIFVPLPSSAGNEQLKNARVLEEQGAAVVLEQKDAQIGRVKQEIAKVEKDYSTYAEKSRNFAKSLPRDGNKVFVRYLVDALKEMDEDD